MRHLLLLPFCLFFLSAAAQYRPDSVLYNGEWHYIYPVPEQLEASRITLQRMGLFEEEFELYRVWYKKNDPRKDLEGKSLHAALKQELIDSKRMTESGYDATKRRFSRIFSRRLRGCVRSRGIRLPYKRKKTWRIARHAAGSPGILVTNELRIDNDLVPYLGELPDGKYIQYFDLFFTFDKQRNMSPLSPKVACVFSLSDNHPEGSYLRFAFDGDTLRSGRFTDGKREGLWRITHTYDNYLPHRYGYFRRNLPVWDHDWLVIAFAGGVPNGEFRSYVQGRLMQTGQLTNGKMTGEWDMRQGWGDERIRFAIGNDADSADWPGNRLVFFWQIPTADGNGFLFSKARKPSADYAYDFMYGLASFNKSLHWESSLKELDFHAGEIERKERYTQKIPSYYNKATYRYLESSWSNGKTAFRYRYDPLSRGVLGASFFDNGKLYDTVGYDAASKQFFRRIYDLNGKLYYEQWSDSLGAEISGVYFDRKEAETAWIDGRQAILEGAHYMWENPEQSMTGNRIYEQIVWYKRSQRLCNDIYSDTANGWWVYTAYNGLERPYFLSRTKLDVHFRESETLPEGDSLIVTEHTWGDMQINSVTSVRAGEELCDRKFLFKGVPYTGDFTLDMVAGKCAYDLTDNGLRINYRWKELDRPEHKRSTKRMDRAAGLAMHDMEVGVEDWTDPMNTFTAIDVDPNKVYAYSGRFENGKPAGEWIFYTKRHKELFRLQYANELPTGTVRDFTHLPNLKKRLRNRYHYRFGLYGAFTEYALKDGQLHGDYTRYWCTGDTVELLHYQNGLLHGPQEIRLEDRSVSGTYDNGKRTGEFLMVDWDYDTWSKTWHIDTTCRFHYLDDQLNGTAYLKPAKYNSDPYISASYLNNQPEGEMNVYDNETHEQTERLLFEQGLLRRRDFYNHSELSYFFEFPASDSIRVGSTFITSKSFDMNLNKRASQRHFNGLYYGENVPESMFREQRKHSVLTRLYPNGTVARKGPLLHDVKTGHWDFFNYGGQQLYSIDYLYPGEIRLPNGSELLGYYTEYDTLGNVISKRAVTEEIEQYNCSHDEYYAIRQYITLEDPDDGIERTNGPVRNYFDNGMLMSEGRLVNGVPDGVWKFYTPDGKLHIVGRYENGLKEGRWLTGDLTDKKYIGDICLDPDDPLLDFHLAQMERELAISVALYTGGELQAKQEYDIRKND